MQKRFFLAKNILIRHLEKPYIYNRKTDELYEMDEEGLKFLNNLIQGEGVIKTVEQRRFLNFLIHQGLITTEENIPPQFPSHAISPSLRYLELQLTRRCNLKCKHCYLGRAQNQEIPFNKVIEIVREFEGIQGLKILISGGEPLLYSKFTEFNEFMKGVSIRRVLITNGTLFNEVDVRQLNFDEVQVSIDGMEASHDILRGKGSYRKAIEGINLLRSAGMEVSIATMVTVFNIQEFPAMSKLFKKLKVRSWGIDLPCVAGYLEINKGILPAPEEAAKVIRFSYGGGYHGSDGAFICGNHLLTVSPDGRVAKCGFYLDKPLGNIFKESLIDIWHRAKHIPVKELTGCRDCRFVEQCLGGCRFRADMDDGRDRVMCYFYNSLSLK